MNSEISQTRRSLSYYHQRTQWALVLYLAESFGYAIDLATLIVNLHNCTDLPQMMNLFTLSQDNKYPHFFIPSGPSQSNIKCQICGEAQFYHENLLSWEQLQQQLEQISQGDQHHSQKGQNIKRRANSFSEGFNPDYKYQISENDIQERIRSQLEEIQRILYPRNSSIFSQTNSDDNQNPVISNLIKKKSSRLQNQQNQQSQCQICYMEYEEKDMVIINGVKHYLCISCMNEYLKEEILNLRVEGISCPHCDDVLEPQVIKGFVSNVVYEKYQTFLRNLEIQRNPQLRWCPNPLCSVVINMNKKSGNVTCPKCNVKICVKCNRIAHPKMSCDAVMRKQLQGLQNAKDIQKCKKCKALVEKISGCNHMTCTVCRYEWCWLCGSTYSNMHFSPLNPLGCAGMQDARHTGRSKGCIYLIRLFILLGILILVPIVLPLTMLFCGPVLAVSYFDRRKGYYHGCCFKFLFYPFLFIIAFVADPFIWIGFLIYITPVLCQKICDYFRQRRRIHQYSQNYLKRRLLEDDHAIVMAE